MNSDTRRAWRLKQYRATSNVARGLRSFDRVLPFISTKRVLDLGCACGVYLARLGPRAVGFELSEPNLARCRERGLAVAAMDLDDGLPVRSGSCNGILAAHVLEHLDSPLEFLFECKRALAPEGVLVLGLPLENTATGLVGNHHFRDHPGHIWAFSPDAAEALLGRAGFSISLSVVEPMLGSRWWAARWTVLAQRLPGWIKWKIGAAYWLVCGKAKPGCESGGAQ